jgi:hypothetical protein
MSSSEHYEQLLAFISTHVPEPFTQEEIDGVMVFTGGSPAEVIVRLTQTSVIVEEYAVWRETPSRRVVRPRRVGLVRWRRLPESALMNVIGELIRGARSTRRSRYRVCESCDTLTPPEAMADRITCRRCASRVVPVVH